MKILILSFYFEPDLCAGSFRNTSIVKKVAELLKNDGQVEVITTLPNRYHTFTADAPKYEETGNIKVWRSLLPVHKSGMIDQSRAFISYINTIRSYTRGKKYDLVYASSSRLMTAALGAFIAKKQNIPLYLDMRDIFTDSMEDLLKNPVSRAVLPVLRVIEKYTVRNASRINLVSPGFKQHYFTIDNGKDYRVYTNGIDDEFLVYDFSGKTAGSGKKEILYAGNIGEGQGLHKIIPGAACKLGPDWHIRIIGDGGMRTVLQKAIKGMSNISIEPPVQRIKLLERYKNADILFLHLNDLPAFTKVLPSKLFEYGATGKPIIAGVAGLAQEFLMENIKNSAVFNPCDVSGFLHAINEVKIGHTPRQDFIRRYKRTNIVEQHAKDIIELAKQSYKNRNNG